MVCTGNVYERKKGDNDMNSVPCEPFGTRGDVVGCGWDLQRNKIFFTKNGALQSDGVSFADVAAHKSMFPAVGIQRPGATFKVNFGQEPFMYAIPVNEYMQVRLLLRLCYFA